MDTTTRKRKEIHANPSNSGWQDVEHELQANVYANSAQWQRLFQLLLPALGILLMVSGILFFFAYNWTDLHKFIKLGLIEGLLVITVALTLFTRWNLPMKQLMLTGASFLVGALFAVYGQIYQTGANAYDFFWGWTLFVTVWVVVSGYLPLWLLWLGLIHVTLYLYKEQVEWDNEQGYLWLKNAHTLICTIAVIVAEWLYATNQTRQRHAWFINTVALAAIAFATLHAIISIVGNKVYFDQTLLIAALIFAGGLYYGYRKHLLFYIATISLGTLLIATALFVRILSNSLNAGAILFLGLMLIAGTTAIVLSLINLKKRWYGTATA